MNSKKFLIFSLVFILFSGAGRAFGAFMTDSPANWADDALTQTGSFAANMSAVWMSGDLAQVENGTGKIKTATGDTADSCDMSAGLFGMIDASSSMLPCLLTFNGSSYFVSVLGQDKVTFSVNYQDSYNDAPSTGYPRVNYWVQGSNTTQTLTLSLASGSKTSGVYSAAVSLPAGIYNYQYAATNSNFPSVYDLPQSSFVVTSRPTPVVDKGLGNGAVTSNGKITLKWSATDPNGGALTYQLYFGKSTNNMQMAYQGLNTSFELDTLDYKQNYYWYVVAIDQYGVTTTSPIYDFSTIGEIKKAFNYPNPFNPARGQSTSIVFDMKESGFAEVQVFSEFGNLCWQRTFYDLPQGINQAPYNGRDESGNMMYNGTYPCLIKKHYQNGEQIEHCRLLIIK